MEQKNSIFAALNAINVNDKTEKKNGLTYLSWAFAWGETKKLYPNATYTVYENADGWNYFTDGRTCWVKTGVTIEGLEHIEYLPVMDYRNASIPADKVTSFDVNKAIQRSLTKAIARHGLGLYIYAGEDLPDDAPTMPTQGAEKPVKPVLTPKPERIPVKETKPATGHICADCGKGIMEPNIAEGTLKAYGRMLCRECGMKEKHRAAEVKKA